jgi:hypothetical protein
MDNNSASPRPFREIPGLWLKVFQMNEPFFAAEAPRASEGNTLVPICINGFALVFESIVVMSIKEYFANNFTLIPIALLLVVALILTTPVILIGFYLNIGLSSLGASIFGGKGNFSTLAYLVSLFFVPITIITVLLGSIPYVGSLIGIGLGIYGIVLTICAIKVVYKLSTGRAVGAFFSPMILFLLIPACMIGILAKLGPTTGNIFSNLIRGLGTPVP